MKCKESYCFGIFMLVFLIIHQQAWSQNNVGIGTNEPNSNAVLQIVAPERNQGLLIPALTTAERIDTDFTSRLSAMENGLMVFDTDEGLFFYWMNDEWKAIVSGNTLEAGEGIELTEVGIINNIGDTDSTNDITNNTLAEGDLSGTFPELNIVPEAVTTEKIAEGAVTTGKIANNTILPQDMQSPGAGKVLVTTSAGTVFWENQSLFGITFLQEGHVYIGNSSNQPAALEIRGDGRILIGNSTSANAVNVSGDISLNSTGNAQINENAVGSTELQNLAVTTNKLADASVTSAKLVDNAVVSEKIRDGAVTTSKIENDAINGDKLADGVLTNIHISNTAAIDITKIAPLAAGNIIVGNGTANQSVSISGDVSLNSTGVVTLNNNATTRSNLGLGSLAVQNADNVNITGGAINATLTGNGAGILGLNANEITTGILPDERLPDVIAGATYGGGANEYISSIALDDKGRIRVINVGSGAPSDMRLKKEIRIIENALPNLQKLEPVTYYWKDQNDETKQFGLIAQQLAEVYPEMVEEQANGYLSVNYIELIPLLIRAVQEQQEEIQKLQDERSYATEKMSNEEEMNIEIQNLKSENEQLKQEIAIIKKALGLTEKALLEE